MARVEIDKSGARKALEVRREPYWGAPIDRGLFLGFRRLELGGNWIARWRNDEGKQLYRSLGPLSEAMDYETARKAAMAWKKAVASGVNTSEVQTVAEACREYVKDRRKEKGEAAEKDVDQRFERTVYDHPIGQILLTKLTERRVEEWRDNLIRPKAQDGHGLSKASANRTMTALKAALNFAVRKRFVPKEREIEWENVRRFEHATNRRELYLDLKQRRALLNHAEGAVRNLIEAATLTGARAGELVSAKRSQFDQRTGEITLSGKTGPRKFKLTPVQLALFKRMAKDKLPEAFLFTRDDGEPWGHSDWDELVRLAATKAELPAGVCLYTLRHSFITEAILGGMTPLEVCRIVGTSLAMIDRHYGHLAQTTASERLAKINFV